MTHAPGPWTFVAAGKDDRLPAHVLDANGRRVATCTANGIGHEARIEANERARLISATRDLLEALEAFMALDPEFHNAPELALAELASMVDKKGQIARTVRKARAAMKKARGTP